MPHRRELPPLSTGVRLELWPPDRDDESNHAWLNVLSSRAGRSSQWLGTALEPPAGQSNSFVFS